MKEGSTEVVNLANNHTFDYLREGFDDTVRALKKEGIGYFGYGYKYIRTTKGIKIGILGYTGFDNTVWTKNQIKKDISELKPKVNLLIVSFYWGEENQLE
ncbi:bacterial capsule synthesis protein [Thermoanaerobacter kivui]|uniref:Bacterial capsule synthesis protein n=1 Tax=Thermoanaerobacter kivui TaxID=2325 RepID=A0A097AUS4_THEKI|nr:bacterial capsule synthesis protein [Thermoanaerobacter kivui]